jgi:aminopeptidase-like protein
MKNPSIADAEPDMMQWAEDLFPICRSLTGPGVRETLTYLQKLIPELKIRSVSSGTKAFDWIVPNEWTIRDAYIINGEGEKIVDFKAHNLHVVGYSEPIDQTMSLSELDGHLYSLPDQPDAIPYVTSYYEKRWGFCISHVQRLGLREGQYRVVIDSTIEPGELNYGEIILPGEEENEIFLSTYLCHPSMANDDLSGLVVTAALVQWLMAQSKRRYSYRIIFIPETIGSIVYLSKHLKQMQKKVIAGFNITCVGDERTFSFLPSRTGNTLADRVSLHILKHHAPDFIEYEFNHRGSDERQYCNALVNLPVASIMRSKYREYPEYHTSLDDLSLISQAGLKGSYDMIKRCLQALEINRIWITKVVGEPFFSKYGLRKTIGYGTVIPDDAQNMSHFVTYSDGTLDIIALAEKCNLPVETFYDVVETLFEAGIIEEVSH